METRFILSATAAAAFHAFVLFGFKPSHAPALPRAKESKIAVNPPPVFVDLTEKDDMDDTVTERRPAPKGEPEQFKPQIDDAPVPRTSVFEQRAEMRRPTPIDVVDKISAGPIGEWEGIGTTPSRLPGVLSPDLLDNTPRTRSQVSPTYPAAERNAGITGEVVVEFVVDETGRVERARIVRSSGTAFEAPTLRAVERWRFEPGKKDGRAVKFRMMVPIQFNLSS